MIGDVEQFLREAVTQLEPEPASPKRRAGRPRILPALCLWAGLLVCVLRGFTSQTALWRLLSSHGFWSYSRFAITDQAVYKRLAAAGPYDAGRRAGSHTLARGACCGRAISKGSPG